ncbi:MULTISPECIES: CsxC family protein [Bacillaceae]|uniref:CsxC family protein n=1 Tax=Bacillaceae TaxID=186817 RepID=UPI000BA7130F|nr:MULTISPECIES: hypothetical protein [Bacillaceae]PAE26329.1 hypothetical protein CHI10_03455 [Bacillus sp. 7894-2]URM31158.1 hypothetical protein LLY41_11985 [Cytobacillus firmus]
MKKNHSYGCGSSDKCPPLPKCDTAKSHTHFCDVGDPQNTGGVEQTIILGDVPIQTLTEADIYLPSYATEIKQIRKNVYLTQCKAVPVIPEGFPETPPTSVKLYVEGYIHKNIQYVDDCEGYVKDYSVNVPFKCYSLVNTLPEIDWEFSNKNSNSNEIRELAKNGMGADRCSFGSFTFEFLNEPIKCKLLNASVTQMDILSDFDKWGRFDKITEKAEVNLLVRLTQRQLANGGGDQ